MDDILIMEGSAFDTVINEAADEFEDAEGYDSSMTDIIDFLNPIQNNNEE